jgi:hypothetical protein
LFLGRRAKERIGAAFGAVLFLALFGGLGGAGMWVTGESIYQGLRARDWVPVEADITHVDTGTATFAYYWHENRYFSDRVGTFRPGGSTDLDDWEDRMDRRLAEAVEQKKPVTAYVNPKNPAEAMLDREIRWKFVMVIMGISFAAFIGGLVAFVLIGRNAIGWRQRGGGVPLLKPRAREALTQWVVALVWNGFCLPLAIFVIPDLWAKGEWFPVILLGLFAAVGLLIAWGALLTTVSVFRDGSPFNARTAS